MPLVGKLLGHRRHRTTAGYAPLVEAAERVGSFIAMSMEILIDSARQDVNVQIRSQ